MREQMYTAPRTARCGCGIGLAAHVAGEGRRRSAQG